MRPPLQSCFDRTTFASARFDVTVSFPMPDSRVTMQAVILILFRPILAVNVPRLMPRDIWWSGADGWLEFKRRIRPVKCERCVDGCSVEIAAETQPPEVLLPTPHVLGL